MISTLVSRRLPVLVIAAFLTLAGCAGDSPESAGPESADSNGRSGSLEVEIFGAGVISIDVPEFATTFSVTGDTVWFSRASADFTDLAIMRSIRTDATWSEPDTAVHYPDAPVADPFMSHDGTRLYISADLSGREEWGGSWDTWIIQRVGNNWTAPMNIGSPPNTDSVDIFVSETLDGDLVFLSNETGRHISWAEKADEGWSEAEALDIPGTEGRRPGNPLVSPSGHAIVFSMDIDESDGAGLFVTCREEGGWSAPDLLPEPINSPYVDFAPGLGANGELYFTSQRPGIVQDVPEGVRRPGDLYRSNLIVEELCR